MSLTVHSLTALRNQKTEAGREIYGRRASRTEGNRRSLRIARIPCLAQAENRMHTMETVMVATLGLRP